MDIKAFCCESESNFLEKVCKFVLFCSGQRDCRICQDDNVHLNVLLIWQNDKSTKFSFIHQKGLNRRGNAFGRQSFVIKAMSEYLGGPFRREFSNKHRYRQHRTFWGSTWNPRTCCPLNEVRLIYINSLLVLVKYSLKSQVTKIRVQIVFFFRHGGSSSK